MWNEELNWLCDNWKTDSLVDHLRRLVFAAFVYHIWKDRNAAISYPPLPVVSEMWKLLLTIQGMLLFPRRNFRGLMGTGRWS